MTPEQLQFLVLEYMSKIPKASKEHIPINEPLRKWDGSKEDLITILRKMEGKSVNISTLHYLSRPNSTLDNRTVRAKLTLQWHSYYAVLESLKIDLKPLPVIVAEPKKKALPILLKIAIAIWSFIWLITTGILVGLGINWGSILIWGHF